MALPMDVLTHINNRLMSIYHTLDHFSKGLLSSGAFGIFLR